MKVIHLIFYLLLALGSVSAQVMWQVKTSGTQKWFLQETDEFSGESLDESKWKYGYPWGNYVYELDLLYKKENVQLDKGVVKLITQKPVTPQPIVNENLDLEFLKKKNKLPNDKGEILYDYSGGAFSSKQTYKYGYFEMRFKANTEKGIWPAFWLYGGSPNEEIDFYEGKGERANQIHVDVHCPSGCEDYKGGFLKLQKNWGAWIKTKHSLADGWNIISGEWQPGYVKFFLNGEPLAYYEGDFKTAQNLILNSAVARDGKAFNPGPDNSTTFPNEVKIDYVRIWGEKENLTTNIMNNYKLFEHSTRTIDGNKLYETELKKKVNFVYNKKQLSVELGTITLLPIFYNKYSLSIAGKPLSDITVEVYDHQQKKQMSIHLQNTTYHILDLSQLPTGPYDVKILVNGQTLTHNVPVLNPAKIGDINKN